MWQISIEGHTIYCGYWRFCCLKRACLTIWRWHRDEVRGEKGASVWTSLSSSLFILHTTISGTFQVYNKVEHYKCFPGEIVWKCSPLSLWWPASHPAFECGWSENTSYELVIFEHNLALSVTSTWWLFGVVTDAIENTSDHSHQWCWQTWKGSETLQLHEVGVLGTLPTCTGAIDLWTWVSFYVCSCIFMGVILFYIVLHNVSAVSTQLNIISEVG